MVMILGMPWGKQAAVMSPDGLPSLASWIRCSKIFWYSDVSGGGGAGLPSTRGAQAMPWVFCHRPVKSRLLFSLYWVVR